MHIDAFIQCINISNAWNHLFTSSETIFIPKDLTVFKLSI